MKHFSEICNSVATATSRAEGYAFGKCRSRVMESHVATYDGMDVSILFLRDDGFIEFAYFPCQQKNNDYSVLFRTIDRCGSLSGEFDYRSSVPIAEVDAWLEEKELLAATSTTSERSVSRL